MFDIICQEKVLKSSLFFQLLVYYNIAVSLSIFKV